MILFKISLTVFLALKKVWMKKNMFEFSFLTSTVRKFSKLIKKNPTTNLSTYFSAVLSYWKHCFVSWYWRFSHSFRSFFLKKKIVFFSLHDIGGSIKGKKGHDHLLKIRLLKKSARHNFIIARQRSSNNIFSCQLLESS